MSTILKIPAIIVCALSATYFVVLNFSGENQNLTCKGTLVDNGSQTPETAYVVLTQYRWWVHLWSADSDGTLSMQTDKSGYFGFVPFIDRIGDGSLALYIFKNEVAGDSVGRFRVANGEFEIRLLDNLVFEGKCVNRMHA